MAMTDARVQAGLTARQAVHALRQTGSKLDKPLLSKMEHGLCYPNRADRDALAALYNTHPDALASYNAPFEAVATAPETSESPSQSKRPGDRHRLSYRISHRVSAEQRAQVDQAVKLCGYGTVQAWLATCTYRLLDEAEKRTKATEAQPLPPIEPGGEYDPFGKE